MYMGGGPMNSMHMGGGMPMGGGYGGGGMGGGHYGHGPMGPQGLMWPQGHMGHGHMGHGNPGMMMDSDGDGIPDAIDAYDNRFGCYTGAYDM